MKKFLTTPSDGATLSVNALLFTILGLTVVEQGGTGQILFLVGGVVLGLAAVIRIGATATPVEQHTDDAQPPSAAG